MNRRDFLGSCALLPGIAALATADASADPTQIRRYTRSLLVDIHGAPIRPAALAAETNYVFQYPFAATPCFLLRLPEAIAPVPSLHRERGQPYVAPAGVGPARNVVSFSAICAHKLAYPTRDVSFIRYQKTRSSTSDAQVIHCCADHSVYDPASGARVLAGPAPQPLAAILLDYDAASDELAALGTLGAEQFDAFFKKYEFKLAMDHGQAKAQKAIGGTSVVRELAQYCKQTIQC
jgi:Rieske Fe-S protein